jgi:hypothetical protein
VFRKQQSYQQEVSGPSSVDATVPGDSGNPVGIPRNRVAATIKRLGGSQRYGPNPGVATTGLGSVRDRWSWLKPWPLALVGAWLAHGMPLHRLPNAPTSEEQLAQVLAETHNLSASPSEVTWIDPPPRATAPYRSSRSWVRAQHPGQLNDIYLVRARRSPEGALLGIRSVHNLTRTSAADESHFSANGSLATFSHGRDGQMLFLEILDAAAPARLPEVELSNLERWQLNLKRLQDTGQSTGIQQRHFKLDPPARQWWLHADANAVRASADGQLIRIPREGPPEEGGTHVAEESRPVALPGNLVTWAVDRVRAMPWFGDERMQWLKAVAFDLLDLVDRGVAPLSNPDAPSIGELGTSITRPPPSTTIADREVKGAVRDWPPPNIAPLLDPPFETEGEWLSLENDPFVRNPVGLGSAIITTFIRPDPDRKFSRVVVALWDPAVVELYMQGGTEEPQSATGEQGSGIIPRDPALLRRVVAAFNGGFQGTHGDYGMMVEHKLLVPPRPYAATVARLEDGTVSFGTWPNSPRIPAELNSFRQNLSPLIAAGHLNPYGRIWWGGVPEGWQDDTRTVRSGLCLTKRHHVAYFYGAKVDHVHLAKAMLQTGCVYALPLDMNQGHTGLEFYRVGPEEEMPPLGLPPHPMWQAEGPLEGLAGYRFRGRRLFKSMQLMNFPRYIRRGERDFFYLALRHTLPGAALQVEGDTLDWDTESLPQMGFPPAQARLSLRPDPVARPGTKLHLLMLDPTHLELANNGEDPLLLSVAKPSEQPGEGLWLHGGVVHIAARPPHRDAIRLASGAAPPGGAVRAAFGIARDTGFLIYAEVATGALPEQDAALLSKALREANCERRLLLSQPVELAVGGNRELSGHPITAHTDSIRLTRRQHRYGDLMFKGTPILKRQEWKPLQQQGFGTAAMQR